MSLSFSQIQTIRNTAIKFISSFIAIISNARLYSPGHSVVIQAVGALQKTLKELFEYRNEISFSIIEEELYVDNIPLLEQSEIWEKFLDECKKHTINRITFHKGVGDKEILEFISLINTEPSVLEGKGGLANVLQSGGGAYIAVSKVVPVSRSEEGMSIKDVAERSIKHDEESRKLFYGAIEGIQEIMSDVQYNRKPNLGKIHDIVQSMISKIVVDKGLLLSLATMKNYDEYTFDHSVNVLIFSLCIGQILAFNQAQLNKLGIAAFLHDVGKVNIPPQIVKKQAALTEDEWKQIRKHPVEGARLLSSIQGLDKLAMTVAFEHHIRYNFSGYPTLKHKRPLHPFSKIVHIADVYDAATSKRVYHKPMSPDKVVNLLLEKRGTYFDSALVKVFVKMIGVFPVGTIVRFDTDEIGIVYRTNPNKLLRPKIFMVNEPEKIIDLDKIDKSTGKYSRTIVGSISPAEHNIDVGKYF